MKKAIILALVAVLAAMFLVGCAETEESAPVGATVRLVSSNGEFIDMYETPISNPIVISNWPPDHECEVLFGSPKTAGEYTFWKLECIEEGYTWLGWFDVTNIETLE